MSSSQYTPGQTVWRKAEPHNTFGFLKVLSDTPDKDLGKVILVRDTKTNEKIKLYEAEVTNSAPAPTASF